MKFSQFKLCFIGLTDYDDDGHHVNASYNLVIDLFAHLSSCTCASGILAFLGCRSRVLQSSEL